MPDGRKVKLRNHWATPDEYIHAIVASMGVTHERFASPLNANPAFQTYSSAFERDQVFGATWDAYRTSWHTSSYCNPEYEDTEMDKAVRWAIASTQHTPGPVLHYFVLPYWKGTSYAKWLTHQNVHTHLVVPRHQLKFKKYDYWSGTHTYASHPKWEIRLFANKEGIQAHYRSIAGM